jgi:predicted enzyme related to lactoylglutathione lyase
MAENRGRFTWYELLTTDVDAAVDFYEKIVGWGNMTWDEAEIPYRMLTLAPEAPIAGVMALPEEAQLGGAPPHWLGYVHTDDLDATLARATELGANTLAQVDVPKVGRMGVFADPQGAVIAVFQPEDDPQPECDPAMKMVGWNELFTDDYQAGFEFYSDLFGWEVMDDMDMGEHGVYRIYGRNDRQLGGIMNRPAEMPAAWLYYITVPDIDAAAAAIGEHGGKVLNGPMEVPGGGKVLQAADPQGAAFALFSPGRDNS